MIFPPFKPRNLNNEMPILPIYLSKRVGIRSIASALGKPLHPSYVCWYNSCEKCGQWTLSPNATCVVDTVNFKENIGSIKITNNTDGVYDYTTLPAPMCNDFLAFWFRHHPYDIDYTDNTYAFFDGSNYIGWRTRWTTQFGYEMFAQGYIAGYGSWGGATPFTFSPDTWYWLEVQKTANSYDYKRDGVTMLSAGPGATWPFTASQFRFSHDRKLGDAWVDYIRYADRFEYPPA